MKIHRAALENACGIRGRREVALPERGLVLVQGANGAGKSSLFVDCVSAALWGETVREAPSAPAPPFGDSAGSVEVAVTVGSERIDVVRTKKGRVTLSYTPGGEAFDTVSKAQPGLTRLVGPFTVWRRLCCFSGEDAVRMSITTLTDGAVIRLVEQVLGIDFDAALKACRADLAAAERAAAKAEVTLREAEVTVRYEHSNLERARAALTAAPAPAPAVDVAKLERRLKALRALCEDARREVETATEARAELAATQRELERRRAAVSADACPTCGAPIDGAAAARAALDAQAAALADALRFANETVAGAKEELAAATDDASRVGNELQEARRQQAAAAAQQAAHARAADDLAAAEAAYKKAHDAMLTAAHSQRLDVTAVATLKAVEAVLGLQGPRDRMVQRALLLVEAETNRWLVHLGLAAAQVRLDRDGRLQVTGVGDPHGYGAASRGQRRRIDLALWLGFRALAPRFRDSTLLFDEPLDGLDAEGRAAAVHAVEELASKQPVVLITHDPALSRALEGRAVQTVNVV